MIPNPELSALSATDLLVDAFRFHFNFEGDVSIVALPGAGSNRRYFRLVSSSESAIGVVADDISEASSFVALSKYFYEHNIPVPQIYQVCSPSIYLQQDLGGCDLLSLIKNGEENDMPERVMDILPRMQLLPRQDWEPLCPFPPFGRRLAMWDLNYFKYEFLKPSTVVFSEERLEDDYENLVARLISVPGSSAGFMWRDCQSRNIMVQDNIPYFIDFQGGRLGPGIYDAVSFAWQAKADFPMHRRLHLVRRYAEALEREGGASTTQTLSLLPDFVLFRLLQVLGAYGFRGLVEHKAHFIESIPAALDNIRQILLLGWVDSYPELKRVLGILCDLPRFKKIPSDGHLHIKVFSFSYKKGYPEDLSGNGGGFMFDCRGLHNPGRYDEFKPLTGLDNPVRDFLEGRGEIQPFLDNAYNLVSPTVECYLRRGFDSLQIGFGCTGGRHRSVYSAQAMAERLAKDYPDAVVELCHREQDIQQVFK
ncbi:MAG: phosphotransferase [Muribaculaceae bacterium]|nr:phosphotransferase [Muribaculaceae bacterium]